jgi:hypothetical protein
MFPRSPPLKRSVSRRTRLESSLKFRGKGRRSSVGEGTEPSTILPSYVSDRHASVLLANPRHSFDPERSGRSLDPYAREKREMYHSQYVTPLMGPGGIFEENANLRCLGRLQ